MNALTVTPQTAIDLPVVTWQEAIEPLLNTLDSPQTRRACRAAIAEAMQGLAVALIDEITAPDADHLPRRACSASGRTRATGDIITGDRAKVTWTLVTVYHAEVRRSS